MKTIAAVQPWGRQGSESATSSRGSSSGSSSPRTRHSRAGRRARPDGEQEAGNAVPSRRRRGRRSGTLRRTDCVGRVERQPGLGERWASGRDWAGGRGQGRTRQTWRAVGPGGDWAESGLGDQGGTARGLVGRPGRNARPTPRRAKLDLSRAHPDFFCGLHHKAQGRIRSLTTTAGDCVKTRRDSPSTPLDPPRKYCHDGPTGRSFRPEDGLARGIRAASWPCARECEFRRADASAARLSGGRTECVEGTHWESADDGAKAGRAQSSRGGTAVEKWSARAGGHEQARATHPCRTPS